MGITVLASTAGTVEASAAVVAAAVAFAALVGPRISRYFASSRSERRNREYLEGWKDQRDYWHPGVIDLVLGWDDQQGHHPGLDARVTALEAGRAGGGNLQDVSPPQL